MVVGDQCVKGVFGSLEADFQIDNFFVFRL